MKEKQSLRELCREVGVSHLQTVEVMRRISRKVLEDDVEVITQTVGTFYASYHKARVRKLNGILYQVPEKVVVALRGPRFPGGTLESGIRLGDVRASIDGVESFAEGGAPLVAYKQLDAFAGLRLTVEGQIENGDYTPEAFNDFPDGSFTIEAVQLGERPVFGEVLNRNQNSVYIPLPLTEPKKLQFGNAESMFGRVGYSNSDPGQGGQPIYVDFSLDFSRSIDTFGDDQLTSV